ncbi:MAG: hypothetical protein LBQ74_14100 [Prevotella sp.]|jgi:hypothetical protein|nr:hypothetical protein [Prevotella sp.]
MEKQVFKQTFYIIENEPGVEFTVQKTVPTIKDSAGKYEGEPEILFFIGDASEHTAPEGHLLIPISKDEAKSLVRALNDLLSAI